MKRTPFKRKRYKLLKRTGFLKRRKRLRKESRAKIPTLKRKLWVVFSKWIKLRDKNICFTCGVKCEGSNCHTGHFIPRSVCGAALYFHPDNNHVQCARCNLWLFGNQYIYGEKLGPEMVSTLRRIQQTTFQPTAEWYEDMIADYTERIERSQFE